jgi:hypothetical protein
MTATASILNDWPIPKLRLSVSSGPSADTSTVPSRLFVRHCIDEFEWLARNNPGELLRLTLGELTRDPVLLSQAAEAMALGHQSLFLSALLKLLDHSRPFVRESALVGLAPFLSGSLHARDRVRAIAEFDSSPGVREAAADVLALL